MCKGPNSNKDLINKNTDFLTSNTLQKQLAGDEAEQYKKDREIYLSIVSCRNQYAVIAKNGSIIPCIPVSAFDKIFPELPEILRRLRQTRASHHDSAAGVSYRESHSNLHENLPEYMLTNHRAPSQMEIDNAITNNTQIPAREPYFKTTWLVGKRENAKWQQLQEYDCIKILDQKKNKLFEDKGALRIVVDESFQEVYVCINHYRNVFLGKDLQNGSFNAVNPWFYVFFEDTMNWSEELTKSTEKFKPEKTLAPTEKKTSGGGAYEASQARKKAQQDEEEKKVFDNEYKSMIQRDQNQTSLSNRTANFNKDEVYIFLGKQVKIIAPRFCKFQRRDSFSIERPIMSEDEIFRGNAQAVTDFYKPS